MGLETKWDVTEYLDSEEAILAYIEAAFEDGDPALIKHALGNVARARGMMAIAKEAGVTRAALYKALSEEGDPRMSTLMGVMKALGLRLSASPSESHTGDRLSACYRALQADLRACLRRSGLYVRRDEVGWDWIGPRVRKCVCCNDSSAFLIFIRLEFSYRSRYSSCFVLKGQ